MRKNIVIGIMMVFLYIGGLARAGSVDIYEDTTINNNIDEYSIVYIHNSARVEVINTSYVSFHLLDTSTAMVYGGNASYRAQNSSVLNLYGGDFFSSSVGYDDNLAKIYVYGQNFSYQPTVGNNGFLSGNWLNETEFNIYFRDLPQPFEQSLGTNIFLVPEPATATLLILGMILTRRRLKK